MNILLYNELNIAPVKKQFDKVLQSLKKGDFKSADVKKMVGTSYYRAKLDEKHRLLFQFGRHDGRTYLLILEVILNHDYEKSRFLSGNAVVDETKLLPINSEKEVKEEPLSMTHVNAQSGRFHILDKILSFDDVQDDVYKMPLPIIIIGSAGSGKTALTLEKMKQLHGNVLYVTLSNFLVENARNLYYSFGYDNESQETSFLSFKEYVETIQMPVGKEMTFRVFDEWIWRYKQAYKIRDAYKIFEEFKGVITGSIVDKPYLTKEEYINLGIKQSVFSEEEREGIYDIFLKYIEFLKEGKYYDMNLVAFRNLHKTAANYDYVVVDEVQDLTNVQLFLILKSLKQAGQFVLCGDSNQIVHPNFFSWSSVKSLFYKQKTAASSDIIRILGTNYRNTPEVTKIANQLLLVKNARFGSIDKESTYLVKTNSAAKGETQFFDDTPSVKKDLNQKTRRSTKFAVLVMRNEDKAEARKFFDTPLIFSVQEAKGLEYDNIILYNIISTHEREFRELTVGVTKQDLLNDLAYSRAKDKSDKSLEVYKFYVNSLYVAITRAVKNLYVVEKAKKHDLLELLGLTDFRQNVLMKDQASTLDDWQKEARKLEMQGKQEQADDIRKSILNVQPVPWEVLTYETLQTLKTDALNPEFYNKKSKDRLFEFAAFYGDVFVMPALSALKYKRADNFKHEQNTFLRNALNDYYKDSLRGLQPTFQRYGFNFRNPYNFTPLMLASLTGATQLIEHLKTNGASTDALDNFGRTAFQIALMRSVEEPNYAKMTLVKVYNLLRADSFKVKINERLVKIDNKQAEFFMLNFMIANLRRVMTEKIKYSTPGFETKDFITVFDLYPPSVIAAHRRKRSYLSSILGKNEYFRDDAYNKKIFFRMVQGFYLPNPLMEILIDDEWVNIYKLVGIDELVASSDPALHSLGDYVERMKDNLIKYEADAAKAEAEKKLRQEEVVRK
jgi:hypothetical protein